MGDFFNCYKCTNFSFKKDRHCSIINWRSVCLLNEACWGMDESLPCSGFLGQDCMMEPWAFVLCQVAAGRESPQPGFGSPRSGPLATSAVTWGSTPALLTCSRPLCFSLTILLGQELLTFQQVTVFKRFPLICNGSLGRVASETCTFVYKLLYIQWHLNAATMKKRFIAPSHQLSHKEHAHACDLRFPKQKQTKNSLGNNV